MPPSFTHIRDPETQRPRRRLRPPAEGLSRRDWSMCDPMDPLRVNMKYNTRFEAGWRRYQQVLLWIIWRWGISAVLIFGCGRVTDPPTEDRMIHPIAAGIAVLDGQTDTAFTFSACKWRGGATAAISITYDAPWGTHANHSLATDAVIERKLRLDLELVSSIFEEPKWTPLLSVYRTQLMSRGIGFFGHGHTHALHDTMTYAHAFESFRMNFELMTQWGLRPRAYAYPGSAGREQSTQNACRDAGFICARGDSYTWKEAILLAGEETAPKNWYFLPSVVMGNASYRYLDTHEKLVPVLDRTIQDGGWVIMMYHAIGIPGSWSFYPIKDFRQDLDAILERDFWSANMDAAACYVMERNALTWEVIREPTGASMDTLIVRLDDGLSDDMYDEPLTFELTGGTSSVTLDGILVEPGQTVQINALPDGRLMTFYVTSRH
jgi:hypothetical protein